MRVAEGPEGMRGSLAGRIRVTTTRGVLCGHEDNNVGVRGGAEPRREGDTGTGML